jgi:hypothetical protein
MSDMSPAARHDCAILLREDICANVGVAAHYSGLTARFAELGDDAGIKYALKNVAIHVKAAVRSFNELEQLCAPPSSESEGVVA